MPVNKQVACVLKSLDSYFEASHLAGKRDVVPGLTEGAAVLCFWCAPRTRARKSV